MSKDLYQTPRSRVDSVDFGDVEPNNTSFYHLKGRIGRLRYLAYQFISIVIFYIILGIGFVALGASLDPESPIGLSISGGIGIFMALLYIPMFVYGIAYAVRRLHDINQSGWLVLLMLVPLINLILALVLIFKKGSSDNNQYGAPPRPNQWYHWVCGLTMPILMAIGIISAITIPAYQDYLNRAEIQRNG